MRKLIGLVVIILLSACKDKQIIMKEKLVLWTPYNDSVEVAENMNHEKERMHYKLIQSKVLDKNEIFRPLHNEVIKLSEEEYKAMVPMILEQNILTIRHHIQENELTYEKLVLFYLYRIYKYELNNVTTLNTIIALNNEVVDVARKLDEEKKWVQLQKYNILFMECRFY